MVGTYRRHVASRVGRSAVDIAELNLTRDGDHRVYPCQLEDSNMRRCWDEVLQQADYRDRLRQVHQFNRSVPSPEPLLSTREKRVYLLSLYMAHPCGFPCGQNAETPLLHALVARPC